MSALSPKAIAAAAEATSGPGDTVHLPERTARVTVEHVWGGRLK
jgi:hypothetical protein